jgi:hypothetical protein
MLDKNEMGVKGDDIKMILPISFPDKLDIYH